jgi:hypothetical protein
VGGQCGKKNLLHCEDSSAVNFSYSTALLHLYTPNTTHFHTDPAVAGAFAVEVLPSPAVVPCLKLVPFADGILDVANIPAGKEMCSHTWQTISL